MKEIKIPFGGSILHLETGRIARQADAAVLVSMDGTQVLVSVVGKKEGAENNSFFPLRVDYQERFYAAGKIPGGFNKREGRPSEQETLIARLLDRPIRPLFPEGFRHEVQVVATVMSFNPEVPPDILAMIGASAALTLSGLPFDGPFGAARVGYREGVYLLNPSQTELQDSLLDLVVAGTEDAVLMVESEAKELSEDIMLGAVLYGQEMYRAVIQGILQLAQGSSKPRWDFVASAIPETLSERVKSLALEDLSNAYLIKEKTQREDALSKVHQSVQESLLTEIPDVNLSLVAELLEMLEKEIVRGRILEGEPRIDGRDRKTVRPIAIHPKILSRTHGSVLFTRGETQALVVATLGNDRDAQILDSIMGDNKDRFMLHYNFPPYSVGETGMLGSPKRREIGHGRLARRAITAVLPDMKAFPYVLRVVSEITESNGSSSMATVCGTSLALMDAGVPIKAPVAGVAMGLIKSGERFAVLTDILGDEDHLGDMDFKVAGTRQGVTALQMDIKIRGITRDVMEEALAEARDGRLHILSVMEDALDKPRQELSEHAPRITTMKVAEDKIRTIIGKGGATIKGLTDSTGVAIDIDDTGLVSLFSPNQEALKEAERQIRSLIADVEAGQTYRGKVSKIVEFGAFINLLPGKDGLLHISQICADRSQKVEAILAEGQELEVFVAGVDKQGRVKLEWKNKPVQETEVTSDSNAAEAVSSEAVSIDVKDSEKS